MGPERRVPASPRTGARPGIPSGAKFVKEEVKTWKQFFEVAPKYSGKIVVVDSPGDVFTAPLKALGYSLNSVDPTELNAAARVCSRLAPHVLALDSDTYEDTLAQRGGGPRRSTWTGGVDELTAEPETARHRVHHPEDGTLYWMDTWIDPRRRAASERRPRVPQLHPGAADPGARRRTSTLRHAERRGEEVRRPGDPRRPGGLRRRTTSIAEARGRRRTSRPTRCAIEIWEEFKSEHRRLSPLDRATTRR